MPGKYRHRLEIRRKTTTRDSNNETVYTSTTVAYRWGHVHEMSASEKVRAGQVDAERVVEIEMMAYDGLQATDELYWTAKNRTFKIAGFATNNDINTPIQKIVAHEVVS